LSELVERVETTGRPVLITRHRRAVAMLVPAEGVVYEEFQRGLQAELEEILRGFEEEREPPADDIGPAGER
jgi:prevent-host-death family protein